MVWAGLPAFFLFFLAVSISFYFFVFITFKHLPFTRPTGVKGERVGRTGFLFDNNTARLKNFRKSYAFTVLIIFRGAAL